MQSLINDLHTPHLLSDHLTHMLTARHMAFMKEKSEDISLGIVQKLPRQSRKPSYPDIMTRNVLLHDLYATSLTSTLSRGKPSAAG